MADKIYDNELRGALFQNKKRENEIDLEKKKKLPHYQGSCEIGGIEYWVAGWKKKSKNGEPFMALSFTPKEKQKMSEGSASPIDDDDIPF